MFLCNNFKYSRVGYLIVFSRLARPIRSCYKSCRISFFEHYDNSPLKLQFPVTFYCSQVSVAIKYFDAMIEIMIWNVILWLLWRCIYIFSAQYRKKTLEIFRLSLLFSVKTKIPSCFYYEINIPFGFAFTFSFVLRPRNKILVKILITNV